MSGTDADNGTSTRKSIKVIDFDDPPVIGEEHPENNPLSEDPKMNVTTQTGCGNPECDTKGDIPQHFLAEASGYVCGFNSYHIVCSEDCEEALR